MIDDGITETILTGHPLCYIDAALVHYASAVLGIQALIRTMGAVFSRLYVGNMQAFCIKLLIALILVFTFENFDDVLSMS